MAEYRIDRESYSDRRCWRFAPRTLWSRRRYLNIALLKKAAEYLDLVPTAKPQKDMVDLAVQLIQKKSAAFDPTKFEDHYGTTLKERPEVLRVFVPRWRG